MNKKLLYNLIAIGFILFLINKISNKPLNIILLEYLNKIKDVIYKIFDIKKENKIKNEESNDIISQKLENNLNTNPEEIKKESVNVEIDDNTDDLNQEIYNILIKKAQNVELPLNVSLPNKCNENDIKNIKKFLENQYKISQLNFNKDIDFYNNNDVYEIKPINISCNMNLNNKTTKCELEFDLVFQQNTDDTIFSSEYNFNKKHGYFTIINFKILDSKEISTQNLNIEKLDTNSIDSLIPDNIFSSDYEKDSSNYTTESQINLDTA